MQSVRWIVLTIVSGLGLYASQFANAAEQTNVEAAGGNIGHSPKENPIFKIPSSIAYLTKLVLNSIYDSKLPEALSHVDFSGPFKLGKIEYSVKSPQQAIVSEYFVGCDLTLLLIYSVTNDHHLQVQADIYKGRVAQPDYGQSLIDIGVWEFGCKDDASFILGFAPINTLLRKAEAINKVQYGNYAKDITILCE